jgi:hypothetical protein
MISVTEQLEGIYCLVLNSFLSKIEPPQVIIVEAQVKKLVAVFYFVVTSLHKLDF